MAILSKACKPDNFESHNSLKLSFTNNRGLHSDFADCKSFLESNSPDILALCGTNLDESIDAGRFSVRGYFNLIRKNSASHMHGLAVYVKEGLLSAWDLSLENSADSYLCFRLNLLHPVSYFFFLYRSPSLSLCTAFDSVSSNVDEVRITVCDSQSPALLDFFLSSDASIRSTMAFPPLGNCDYIVVSVSIDFPLILQRDPPFHRIVYDYSRADLDGLCNHLIDVPWEDIFKLRASATDSEFFKWVQLGIDVYIPYGFQLFVP